MIDEQMISWVVMSLVSGIVAYLVLTEGKSRFLLVLAFFFDLFFGISTGYIWIQATKGLAMYDWALFFLPAILTSVATLLLLSYYVAYHRKQTLPRVPAFTVKGVSFTISLVAVVLLSLLVASSYLPAATTSSITALGSGRTILETSDVLGDECLSCISSSDITIQQSVVTPFSIRENPKKGEYLDFKIEFKPTISYTDPSLMFYVSDSKGQLIPETKIFSYSPAPNVLQGQILCDELGTYTITAVAYDLSVSGTLPMGANTQSYIVQAVTSADEGQNIVIISSLVACLAIVLLIWLVALHKKYS
ncbi:MAG: hypothetical protein IMZ53_08385 [Thermoplasmata archaeon]|nr:hypothetical protein [Thermoplasmata archaeon]MBE3140586.1 hypothetical protein [Thermoplasmata archaeon]